MSMKRNVMVEYPPYLFTRGNKIYHVHTIESINGIAYLTTSVPFNGLKHGANNVKHEHIHSLLTVCDAYVDTVIGRRLTPDIPFVVNGYPYMKCKLKCVYKIDGNLIFRDAQDGLYTLPDTDFEFYDEYMAINGYITTIEDDFTVEIIRGYFTTDVIVKLETDVNVEKILAHDVYSDEVDLGLTYYEARKL
ncbi:hypothetical protein HNP86_001778 [Methanococcus maripaludis]|uniref:Uncharacterized protein n=1 Tax=Methanococcus maripaludis TaxID=39152 RepID=A0A7J9NVC2_METMI|nr:hypothetical protein [Methanococcus maripaludis]MBA2851619.1 hypothetical protein [Methanococcus maripaludis]